MAGRGGLSWYARRLAGMSPAELVFRAEEALKRRRDAARPRRWADFAFDGEVAGLPGLGPPDAVLQPLIEAEARAAVEGRFRWLGQAWPEPERADWWAGEVWTLDPASGRHWPGAEAPAAKSAYRGATGLGDVKLVWELNRLQVLQPLAAAAAADADDARVRTVEAIVAGWMAANPPFRGVNWTNGIEAASRVVSLLAAVGFLSARASAGFQADARAFLAAHAWAIARYPSLHSSANNHRVAELGALLLAGLAAPALPGAPGYLRTGRAGLEAEIQRQFHADGVGAEQSPTYAAYSLEWFLLAGIAAEQAGAPMSEAYRAQARRAAEHLRWITDDAGFTPSVGDNDEGRVLALTQAAEARYPASVCALAARWLGAPELAPPARDPALRDLLCATAVPSVPGPQGLRVFEAGGYSVSRRPTAAGGLLAVFDHAPLGFLSIAAHGHADALSVWLHWGEEPILVDAGTWLYHAGGDGRDRFRGTAAHNTLCVEGADQSRIAGPFNWSAHARAAITARGDDWVEAEHDGYQARFGLRHRRRVRFTDDGLQIEDRLDGASTGPRAWSGGFTFAPEIRVAPDGDGWRAETPAGRRLSLRFEDADGGRLDAALQEGLFSPAFGEQRTAPRLVIGGEGARGGVVARTVLACQGGPERRRA